MERKKFSKFFSFISNFLKVSFLSAIVALGFSYNSSVKAIDDGLVPDIKKITDVTSDSIGDYYDEAGIYVSLGNIVYAIKQDGGVLKATGIYYDGEQTQKMTIPSSLSYTDSGTQKTATVVGVIPNLLNKIPENGELILPNENVKLIMEGAGTQIPSDGNGKVYVSVADKTTPPDSSFDDWAKGINAKDATVSVKEGNSVSYTAGKTTLADVKLKLNIVPDDTKVGYWIVKAGDTTLMDDKKTDDKVKIPSNTETLSFSFEATAGDDGKYEYKNTTKQITLKEEKGSEAKTPSVSKSKIVYTANKTTWKELIDEAGVTPNVEEAKGHWTITDKDRTTTYYDLTAGKDGNKAIESGTSEVVFNYVPKSDDAEESYKGTSITVTLVEGISCKDFNIKANVSRDNPTLENVQLPSEDDTKVVDGSGNPVSGTWEWSDKSKSVAKFENTDCGAVFTPSDKYKDKYPTITKNFKVYNLGKTQTFGDHNFSVSGDGVTSGVVSGKGITWIRESSGGTAAWYGFDNSDGILPDGATVAVRWIGAKENPEEYAKYVEQAKELGKPFEDNKLWVFEVRAFDSDMNEIKDFGKDEGGNPRKMKFYIESGDDWDADDVIAFFIDTEGGNPELWDVSLETKSINGEEKEFIVAKLSHLSAHFVGDENTAKDILKNLQKAASDAGTKYKLEHPDASLQDLQNVQREAMIKAYEQLSDGDKKLFAKYAEFLQTSESEDSGNSSENEVTPQGDNSSSGYSNNSTPKSSTYSTSSSPSTTTSSSKIKTGSDISNLLFLMQYVFGTSIGTAIISKKKKFD